MREYYATFIALATIALINSGCGKPQAAKRTHLLTVAAGHEVELVTDGVASIDTQAAQSVISSPFGPITVEYSRVLRGTNVLGTIPVGVPIQIDLSTSRYAILWTTRKAP
jgi:hypothetical protein